MSRITQRDLEAVIKQLNTAKGFEAEPKYSTVGSFDLDYAYGGVQVLRYVNTAGACEQITGGYETKRVCYDKACMFLSGLKDN